MLLPLVPEHSFAKDQPEGHFVYQGFECARICVGAWKMRMGPSPKIAMPISAVVSLNSEPKRVAFKGLAIQRDLAEKKRVRMRCPRESNPTLVAQRDAKHGTIVQIPRDGVPLNLQCSPAGALADFVATDSEVEWTSLSVAETQALQGKSLNEAFRRSISRKPYGPHLDGHPVRLTTATASARIHQQISEPPRPGTIR
jgi:hypothetical protein